jgi:MSHA biogenesis protein MshN
MAGTAMSFINQMLRDLDARAAGKQDRSGLPPRLRPLPPPTPPRLQPWHLLALGIGVGALSAGIAIYLLLTAKPAPPPAPPVLPPVVIAPPAMPPAEPPVPTDSGEMKISTLLAQTQTPAEAGTLPPPPAAKPPSASAAAKPPGAIKPAPPVPPAAPSAQAASPDAQIDKRPKGGQGREMAEAEYRKGMQEVQRGDNAAALAPFQRALEFDPAFARARQALLSVLVGARQWAEAQQAAQRGLALDPAQTGWAMILARLQLEQGDAAGAVATLEKHAAYAHADADYQGLFAYLLQKQQRPAEAAEHFRAAVGLRPGEGRWWFGLGLALEGAGRGGEAKEAYAKARAAGNLPADLGAAVEQKLK